MIATRRPLLDFDGCFCWGGGIWAIIWGPNMSSSTAG